MPYSSQLYENMPLYARLADETGLLQHVCEAYQPELDAIFKRLHQRDNYFDPELAPDNFLDWLGQFVGLASVEGHWLGRGLNPEWSADHKRLVISRAWFYWQLRGTEWGIREALALWLQWGKAHNTQYFQIALPFGKVPTAYLPQWWDYSTPFDAWRLQSWKERQQLGSGDYPQTYQPDWFTLQSPDWYWGYDEVWSDRSLVQELAPTIQSLGSALGPERPWMHLYPNAAEWNQLFPDVLELNAEIWSTFSQPTTFGWLETTTPPVLLRRDQSQPQTEIVREYEIEGFQYTDLFPFNCTELEDDAVRVRTEPIEFGIWGDFEWGDNYQEGWWYVGLRVIQLQIITMRLETAAQFIRVANLSTLIEYFATIETVSQPIASSTLVGTNVIPVESMSQAIEAVPLLVDVGAFILPIETASQPISSNSLLGSNIIPIETASQPVSSNSLLGSNIIPIEIASQPISSNSLLGSNIIPIETASQPIEADAVTVQLYDWFFMNVAGVT